MRKKLFDIFLIILLAPVTLPTIIIISFFVRISLGAPVFFCQMRPGLDGKPFKMIKFRTMTNECDSTGNLLPDKVRLRAFGKFLRSTSLDELPELWNVIKGQMSLVGPRPLLMEYLTLYTPEQARRHEACPGITGWAQVNGRNNLSWEEKFGFDVWYVDNATLWLDVKIILFTVKQVLFRNGIASVGHVTASKFQGSKQ